MPTSPAKLAYDRAYHAANRERILERKRRWWSTNRVEQLARHAEYRRVHKRPNKYGITVEQLSALELLQGGACAGCGVSTEKLQVDHDHVTNRVRGLLCLTCNLALGSLKDNPETMRRLIEYLARPPFEELG